jgi:hypothetical protein
VLRTGITMMKKKKKKKSSREGKRKRMTTYWNLPVMDFYSKTVTTVTNSTFCLTSCQNCYQ